MKKLIILLIFLPLFFACGEKSSSNTENKKPTQQPPILACGDGVCEDGETESSCPADCKKNSLSINGEPCSKNADCMSNYCAADNKCSDSPDKGLGVCDDTYLDHDGFICKYGYVTCGEGYHLVTDNNGDPACVAD